MKNNGNGSIEKFFEDDNFLELVDLMAKRYGKLPHQIVRELSVSDYNFNLAVMYRAIELENERSPKRKNEVGNKKKIRSFKDFGIKHHKIDQSKKE